MGIAIFGVVTSFVMQVLKFCHRIRVCPLFALKTCAKIDFEVIVSYVPGTMHDAFDA